MNLGVWMSRGVLAHKRGDESLQAWNLKSLPDELSQPPEPHRLFIATEGFWRGYFVLEPYVSCNFADTVRPWTMLFIPASVPNLGRLPVCGYAATYLGTATRFSTWGTPWATHQLPAS